MGPSLEVMFEADEIILDISEQGLVLENGWTITPHTYRGVSELLLISLTRKNSITQFVDNTFVKCMCACRYGTHDLVIK